MRSETENLGVQRNRFEELQKKLENEYHDLRQELTSVIENSNTAYDQRKNSQAKMVLLRGKEGNEKQQLNAELKELNRVIDVDKKLMDLRQGAQQPGRVVARAPGRVVARAPGRVVARAYRSGK
jgi:hypothetical protein